MLFAVIDNVMGPVFDYDLGMIRQVDLASEDEDNSRTGKADSRVQAAIRRRRRRRSKTTSEARGGCFGLSSAAASGDAILDQSGPKLIEGLQAWINFYSILGHINFSRAPLYLNLIFRLLAFTLSQYIMVTHFVAILFRKRLFEQNYANPIFLLISFLCIVVNTANCLVVFYTNSFKLCPLFKILTTRKLCFVKVRTQHSFGTNTLKYMLVFLFYHSLLYRALLYDSLGEFFHDFNLFDVLIEYYATVVQVYYSVGLAHVDFYIRCCFGLWLLALKANLECRFARFKYLERLLKWEELEELLKGSLARSQQPGGARRRKSIMSLFQEAYKFVSLDEVQKNLNTMDDHLEVWRSVQTLSLVLVNLNAFLTSGSLFLAAYNNLAKANNYYCGLAYILLALNYAFLFMLCYLGDSFIFYALGKFVQTVEDEYFLQDLEGGLPADNGKDKAAILQAESALAGLPLERRSSEWAPVRTQRSISTGVVEMMGRAPLAKNDHDDDNDNDNDNDNHLAGWNANRRNTTVAMHDWREQHRRRIHPAGSDPAPNESDQEEMQDGAAGEPKSSVGRWRTDSTSSSTCELFVSNKQFLSIKRSDVLFCRELLEQFENHLATPWSKLTFKVHLDIMATFATLIAAQIIFDSH